MIQQQISVILWIALTAITGVEAAHRFDSEGIGSLWGWVLGTICLVSLFMTLRARKARRRKIGV